MLFITFFEPVRLITIIMHWLSMSFLFLTTSPASTNDEHGNEKQPYSNRSYNWICYVILSTAATVIAAAFR